MIICQICNKEFKEKTSSLGTHLKYIHNITTEEYYRKYISNELCMCGKQKRFLSLYIGLRQTCGNKYCAAKQLKLNYFKNTGFTSPSANPEVKERKIATFQRKYNKDNAFQVEEFKDKIKETCEKRYGSKQYLASEDKQIKSIITCQRKYKKNNQSQDPEIKEKSRQTSIKHFGVGHHLQNPDFFDNDKKKKFKHYPYTMPSGKIVSTQGYEALAIYELLQMGYLEEDLLIGKEIKLNLWYTKDDKRHRYFPDIYIISENKIIEVKSGYTYSADIEINLLKQQVCLDAGYNFEFLIYERSDINKFRKMIS